MNIKTPKFPQLQLQEMYDIEYGEFQFPLLGIH